MPPRPRPTLEREILYRLDEISRNLRDLLSAFTAMGYKIDALNQGVSKMSTELDALTAQVAQNTSVEASAVTLIQGLAAQLAAAGTDPAKLSALQSQLNTSATALAAAITANTPAAPAAPSTPAPAPAAPPAAPSAAPTTPGSGS